MLALAHAILRLDGAKTEGIFRVPAPASELTKLIAQFDSGNFAIEFNSETVFVPSVHCAAGSLKKLLRETPEPLVPSSMYDKAISSQTLGNADNAVAIIATLPPINRKVMLFLIRYLQEFLSPGINIILPS